MIDWTAPLDESIQAETVEKAAELLPFTPKAPSRLGSPVKVLVNDPGSVPRPYRGFALRYDTPAGLIWLLVEVSETTQADLEGLAAQCDPAQGCEGKWEVVTLGDGTRALLIDGPSSVTVIWLHDGLKIHVIGPPGETTADEALGIANDVVVDSEY